MAFKRNREPWPGTGHQGSRHHGHGDRAELAGHIGWECWSKRDSLAGTSGWDLHDKDRKTITHRMERRVVKEQMAREKEDEEMIAAFAMTEEEMREFYALKKLPGHYLEIPDDITGAMRLMFAYSNGYTSIGYFGDTGIGWIAYNDTVGHA